MSETPEYVIVSADSHVIEPHDLWQTRVAARYRDATPHLSRDEDSDRIVMNGKFLTTAGLLAGCARGSANARPRCRRERARRVSGCAKSVARWRSQVIESGCGHTSAQPSSAFSSSSSLPRPRT